MSEETKPIAEVETPAVAPQAEKETKKEILNASVKPEDFDWDAFESDSYGSVSKEEVEKAYDSTLSKIVENDVVEGEVTSVNKREVVVTIGGKSEGVIPVSEFRYNSDLKVGDKVEVYVESAEDKKGQLVLSHRKARALKSWDRVNEAFEKDEIVKGFVKTRTKGGMIVDVFGIEAFLPGSQIDIKPIRDYDQYVNQSRRQSALSSSASLKRARYSKALSRTSPTTVCSLTSAELTVSSISPIFHGVV